MHFLRRFYGILQDLDFNIESCCEQIWVPRLLDTAVTMLYEVVKGVGKEAFYNEKAVLLKSLSHYMQINFCPFFDLNFDLTEMEWWRWTFSVP